MERRLSVSCKCKWHKHSSCGLQGISVQYARHQSTVCNTCGLKGISVQYARHQRTVCKALECSMHSGVGVQYAQWSWSVLAAGVLAYPLVLGLDFISVRGIQLNLRPVRFQLTYRVECSLYKVMAKPGERWGIQSSPTTTAATLMTSLRPSPLCSSEPSRFASVAAECHRHHLCASSSSQSPVLWRCGQSAGLIPCRPGFKCGWLSPFARPIQLLSCNESIRQLLSYIILFVSILSEWR